jgi:hypothetical protein
VKQAQESRVAKARVLPRNVLTGAIGPHSAQGHALRSNKWRPWKLYSKRGLWLTAGLITSGPANG